MLGQLEKKPGTNMTIRTFLYLYLMLTWLCFSDSRFYARIIEGFPDHPMFLNSYTKLSFCSENSYFYIIPLKVITEKLIIIRDMCRFSQPGFISYMKFQNELGQTNLSSILWI